MNVRQRIITAMWCVALGWTVSAAAQQPPGEPAGEEHDVIYFNQAIAPPAGAEAGIRVDGVGPFVSQAVGQAMAAVGPAVNEAVTNAMTKAFTYVSAVGLGPGKMVVGAPYSAEASTEIVQTLADGNRIVRKMTASVYRDSEGRTRRDQTLGALGPWVTTSDPPQISFISDPVAKVQYVLDHKEHTAREMPLRSGPTAPFQMAAPPPPPGSPQVAVVIRDMLRPGPGPLPQPEGASLPAPVVENLGKQTIEGVEAEGTRSTVIIPAGSIGNELPIQIVSERWYSATLQEVMLSTNSDPRSGTTTYKLTGLSRNEPPRSLFEVPPGYTLIQPPIVDASGFADCVAAGNPVAETMPRTCRTADGKTYVDAPPGPGLMPFNRPVPPPLP